MSTPVRQLFDLDGRVALVTGGSRGLGLQIAEALGEAGAKVMLTSRKAADLEEAVAELSQRGIDARWIAADASRPDEVQRVCTETLERLGPIDILVNNAGVTVERRAKGGMAPTFLETQPDDWEKILDLNIWGMLHCCHKVLPGMKARHWGRIVNIMSEAGRAGEARLAVYSGAKAAMLGFAKAIAQEHGRDCINVNTVALGAVSHEGIQAGPLAPDATPENNERLAKMLGAYPVARGLQRLCTPEDVAPIVCLLASDRAQYITGQSIGCSGGFVMI